MEDFENYLKDPNRDPESEYMQKSAGMTDGPPKKVVWLEIIE